MPYDLGEIIHIRKNFGLTQAELAKKAGVSQSLIAKIESGRIDPTYSNVKKIFNAISSISQKKELKASQIMQKKVVHTKPSNLIKDAIVKMKKHEISQMPVIENNSCTGLVSEAIILNSLGKGNQVRDIMSDAPPIVSENSSINIVSELLKHYPLVVVSDRGRIRGVITKSDIIRGMYR